MLKRWIVTASLVLAALGCGSGVTPEGGSDGGSSHISSYPQDGATEVSVSTVVTATFDVEIDSSTLTIETFLLAETDSEAGVEGTVSLSGATATFTPAADLAANTGYTATITNGVADSTGVSVGQDYSWSFTTGSGAGATVGFSADVQPIFTANCTAGCHSPGGTSSFLNLSSGESWGGLVNQPATLTDYSDLAGETLVVPYNSADSVLYRRISQTGTVDGEQPMPFSGSPLSDADQGTIGTWIDEGAQDN